MTDFARFLSNVGAKVNATCGCHITISVESVIGTTDPLKVAHFMRKVVKVTRRHTLAVFGQTGTARHLSKYCKPIPDRTLADVNDMIRPSLDPISARAKNAADICGRGMLNLTKVFSDSPRRSGLIEFRAFAGTLNADKLRHHIATVFGIVRKAHTMRTTSGCVVPARGSETATEALCVMWSDFGWTQAGGFGQSVALGLFGDLHARFESSAREAHRLCEQFQKRFPASGL